MADTVAYHLERMLPQLEDLEKRELFTREEIQEIVRKRRDFEYLLKRHSPLKQDFLRYVDYETQLEAFRRTRKEVLCQKLRSTGQSWRTSLCDRASAMQIMLIYERAVTRFKGDLDLWLQYAEYCRGQGSRRLQKVLMKALQLHPTVSGLWIYASLWEAEHNSNATAARALMQQGLRVCPKSETLWLEYFRMELIFAQKVKARRLVLGLVSATGEVSEIERETIGDEGVEAAEKSGTKSISHHTASCKIARAIYKSAIAAIPDSLTFRQQFLEIVEAIDLEKSEALEGEIYASLRKDFIKDEDSWAWLARRHQVKAQKQDLGILEGRQKAIKVYEEALQSVPSVRMYELYAQFLISQLEFDDAQLENDQVLNAKECDSRLEQSAKSLLDLYNRAKVAGVESEILAQGQVALLLRWGNVEEAREVTEDYCKEGTSTCGSARMWTLLLSLETKRMDLLGLDGMNQVAKLYKRSLTHSNGDVKFILQMAAELQTGGEKHFDGLLQTLETILAGTSRKQAGAEVASALVDWVHHAEGFRQARGIYTRLLALPSPSLNLLKSCITLETSLVGAGDVEAFRQLRKLYNKAVELYGKTDCQLWLEYCAQERKGGNIKEASNVYWRAKNFLTDSSEFVERYQFLE